MQLDTQDLSRRERVMRLHEGPLLMPSEWAVESVLSGVVKTLICLIVLFTVFSALVERNVGPGAPSLRKRRLAYQATNLIVNCFLGLAGLYCEFYMTPASHTLQVEELITNFNHFQYFGNLQLGYQLWAIPIGLFWVSESTPMLVHHFATILVSSMSSLCTNGFRYYAPFFYGLIEITSVPLSIMNTFKDHPHWIEKHKFVYLVVRLVFAFSFLYVRLVLFVPRMFQFLRDLYLIASTSDNRFYQMYMALVWGSSFFLQLLQIWWGWLIVKGLLKVVLGGDGKERNKSEEATATTALNGRGKKNE